MQYNIITMAKSKKIVLKDPGNGSSQESLDFATQHLEDLSQATSLKAVLNNSATTKSWQQYNVRFSTPLGIEFHFSGLNIGYKGTGPQTLVKVLKLINWDVNRDLIFINEQLHIARELPKKEKDEE